MGTGGRMVLIALGAAVLVVVLIPLLFMGGMMGMMGGGQCCGGMAWAGLSVGLLVALGAIGLIVFALRRRS
jgi:hypothetical protein